MRLTRYLAACIAVSLIGITLIAYFPVFYCDFVTYDDPIYVYQNPRVLAGLSIAGWNYAWTSFDCGNWHPLTWLSLQLDGTFWGKNPFGYHTTNLVLHILNSVLLFVVLKRLTKNLACAAVVAALFAVHPLHVESVAWIAERKDVLCTLFLLLTLLAYDRYVNRPCVAGYLLVLLLYSAGLLAKPMLVTVPFLLLLLDVWPLDRIQSRGTNPHSSSVPRRLVRRVVIEKLPLICLALLDGLVTIKAQDKGRAIADSRILSYSDRIANALDSYGWYLWKTFLPMDLIVHYPHPILVDLDSTPKNSWTAPSVLIGLMVFTAITVLVILFRKTKPHLAVGWAWFVISLLPVIGLLQVGAQSHADRYAYIPHIGLFVAIVWEVNCLLSKSKIGQIGFGAISLIAILSCVVLTRGQVVYWKNGDTLWTHALTVIPDNYAAHAHLADIRFEEGQFEKALEHIERGRPVERGKRENNMRYVADGYYNWGRCLMALDRPVEAEEKFRQALSVNSDHEGALNEISKLLEKQGRQAEAAQHAELVAKWARKNPQNPTALLSMGLAEARRGNLVAAIRHFQRVVEIDPNSAEGYSNLGLALAQANRLTEAKTCLLRVLELNQKVAVAHFTLAQIYEEERDLPNARKHYAEAYRLDPKDQEAKNNLDRLNSK